jgi:hypothetical protein
MMEQYDIEEWQKGKKMILKSLVLKNFRAYKD